MATLVDPLNSTDGLQSQKAYPPQKFFPQLALFNSSNKLNQYLVDNSITTLKLPCFIAIQLRVARLCTIAQKTEGLSSKTIKVWLHLSNSNSITLMCKQSCPHHLIKGLKANYKSTTSLIRLPTFITRPQVGSILSLRGQLAGVSEEWNHLIYLS